MKLTRIERVAIGAIGVALFCVCVFRLALPAQSSAAGAYSIATSTPAPTPKPSPVATVGALVSGPIFDPFAPLRAKAQSATGMATATLNAGMPSNPGNFNLDAVPPLVTPGQQNAQVSNTVYALGTDYAILVQGGPIVRVGSTIAQGVTVTRIDDAGVHLSNGETLVRRAGGAAAPVTSAASSSPPPSPTPPPIAPTPVPSPMTASDGSDDRAGLRKLLILRANARPNPNPTGGQP